MLQGGRHAVLREQRGLGQLPAELHEVGAVVAARQARGRQDQEGVELQEAGPPHAEGLGQALALLLLRLQAHHIRGRPHAQPAVAWRRHLRLRPVWGLQQRLGRGPWRRAPGRAQDHPLRPRARGHEQGRHRGQHGPLHERLGGRALGRQVPRRRLDHQGRPRRRGAALAPPHASEGGHRPEQLPRELQQVRAPPLGRPRGLLPAGHAGLLRRRRGALQARPALAALRRGQVHGPVPEDAGSLALR
mmetsp:Transcript_36514/g.112466  ORF Transcript_36514/g.112466 Transcript_36514/m.112466 type:complete len:246 (-) Transcript_36514:231-968(-)